MPQALHVQTSLPYAASVAVVAMLLGTLPMGLGLYGPAIALPLCLATMVAIVLLCGHRTDGLPRVPSRRWRLWR